MRRSMAEGRIVVSSLYSRLDKMHLKTFCYPQSPSIWRPAGFLTVNVLLNFPIRVVGNSMALVNSYGIKI